MNHIATDCTNENDDKNGPINFVLLQVQPIKVQQQQLTSQ